MPPRTRKTTAPEPDEAQAEQPPEVHDAEVVDEKQEEPSTQLGKFQAAFQQARNQIKSEMRYEFEDAIAKLEERLAATLSVPGAELVTRLQEVEHRVESVADAGQEQFEQILSRIDSVTSAPPVPRAVAESAAPLVYGKVLELMRRVNEISKDRQAKYGDGAGHAEYAFRGVDDAMNAVGSALRSVGLVLETRIVDKEFSTFQVPKVNRNGQQYGVTTWATSRVTVAYTFIAPEDGSRQTVEGLGVGRDSGDKDGSKALSAAMKYALFQGLCIPVRGVNIDPEMDHPDTAGQEATPAEAGWNDLQREPAAEFSPVRAEQTGSGWVPPEPPADDPWAEVPPADAPQQQAPAQAPAPAGGGASRMPSETPEQHKLRRATEALAAARRCRNMAELSQRIVGQASREGLMSTVVEGLQLKQHITAIANTLPREGQ